MSSISIGVILLSKKSERMLQTDTVEVAPRNDNAK